MGVTKIDRILNWIMHFLLRHTFLRIMLYIIILILALNGDKCWRVLCNWYAVENIVLIYICILLIVIFLGIEAGIIIKKEYSKNSIEASSIGDSTAPLIDDTPTIKDKYGRDEYVTLLGKKIVSTFNDINGKDGENHAFAINIEENYGFGKTSFLCMLHKWFIQNLTCKQYCWIDFKPWLCESKEAMMKEFFTQLGENIRYDWNLENDFKKYGQELVKGIVNKWLGLEFSEYFHSKPSLKELHDKIERSLSTCPYPIIVTIDDLDRLDAQEVMAVLKLVRNTADFPNIFYITAAEHSHTITMLQGCGIKDADHYLEKFYNLIFYLPANEFDYQKSLSDFLNNLLDSNKMDNKHRMQIEGAINNDIFKSCFHELRDMKEYINIVTLKFESLYGKEYNAGDVMMISLLEYKCPELYKVLRDNNSLLLGTYERDNDHFYKLNENPESDRNIQEMLQTVRKEHPTTNDKKEKQEEIKGIGERLNITVRNERLGEQILDKLFGRSREDDNTSITRVNRYFTYFAGKESSHSITLKEVQEVLKMESDEYRNKIHKIFQDGKGEALINEIHYFLDWNLDNAIERVKKFIVILQEQYEMRPKDSHANWNRFTYAMTIQRNKLTGVVINLFEDKYHEFNEEEKNKARKTIEEYLRKGDLPYMVTLLSALYRGGDMFHYLRNNLREWSEMLLNRLFEEFLLTDSEISEEAFSMLNAFRNDWSSLDVYWDKKFSTYLLSDKGRLKQWFHQLIISYEGGQYGWYFEKKEAMFGTRPNERAEKLLDDLSNKYPPLKENFASLKRSLRKEKLEKSDWLNVEAIA